ncbi:MAG: hypothetical protein NC347_02750 [Clostridium sp.]|nr:hypothetical protein [Clostridium sp.]
MDRKRRRTIRIILFAFLLMAAGFASGKPSYAAEKNGWSGSYFYVDGKKQTSKWVKDKHGTYYVGKSGKKVTGWKKIRGKYYYLNEAKSGKLRNSKKKTGVRLSTLSNKVLTMGIDMSQWQGNVDWKKIKDSGVDFVMLRLGYGKGRYGSKSCTMDSKFQSYVKGAQEVGLPIGIYFYSYAKNPKQAQAEAEYTIEHLEGIDVSFPVAYDIEDETIVKAANKATRTEMARTYMETIQAAGYTPMFYCNQNWYDNYLDADQLKDYEFWYARYTYVEPDRSTYDCGMWQATSTQKLSGITENTVDLNFLYRDYFKSVKTRSKALKYGWHKEGGSLYYYYQGKKSKSGWLSLAGEKYYLKNGEASVGWKTIDNERYYFNSDGEMQTGFTKIKGKIYLLGSDGILQTTTKKQGVTIREDGSCVIKAGWYKNAKGKYYYQYTSGKTAKNKWVKVKGKKYYCDSKGFRVTGFKTIKGKRYYFQSNGVMKKGWLTYKNKKYYFKSNGQMVKNRTIKIKGKKYKFNKKGHLVK